MKNGGGKLRWLFQSLQVAAKMFGLMKCLREDEGEIWGGKKEKKRNGKLGFESNEEEKNMDLLK